MDGARQQSARETLTEWLGLFKSQGHILVRHPGLLFQQAANQPDRSAPARQARALWESGAHQRPWVRWSNKPQAAGAGPIVLRGHSGPVVQVALDPEARRIFSSSRDGTLRAWAGDSGEPLSTMGAWKVWDLEDLAGGGPHQEWIWPIAVSPDGALLASCRNEPLVRIFRVEDGQELAILEHAGETPTALAFLPDGRLVTAGTRFGVWSLTNRKLTSSWEGHGIRVEVLRVSRDGRTLASANFQELKLWDLERLAMLGSVPLYGTSGVDYVSTMTITADLARLFLTRFLEGSTIELWDPARGRKDGEIRAPLGSITGMVPSPDGATLACGANTGAIHLFEVATGRLLRSLEGHARSVSALAFSRDGRTLVSGAQDASVRIWELGTPATAPSSAEAPDKADRVAFFPDGERVAVAHGGQVRVFHLPPLDERGAAAGGGAGAAKAGSAPRWSPGSARVMEHSLSALFVAPGGNALVWVETDYSVSVWERGQDAPRRAQGLKKGGLSAFALSPEGRHLAVGTERNLIQVWDLAALATISSLGEEKAPKGGGDLLSLLSDPTSSKGGVNILALMSDLTSPKRGITALQFTAEGESLISASRDGTVAQWEVGRNKPRRLFRGHQDPVTTLAVSLDGRFVAAGSSKGEVILWELSSGKEVIRCAGYLNQAGAQVKAWSRHEPLNLYSMVFSRGSERLYWGSWEGLFHSVHLGRVQQDGDLPGVCFRWHEEGGYRGHQSGVRHVQLTPDHRYVISGGAHDMIAVTGTGSDAREGLFPIQGHVVSLAAGHGRAAVIDETGALFLLELMGLPRGEKVVASFRRRFTDMAWCPWCGQAGKAPGAGSRAPLVCSACGRSSERVS